jgi:hypothetical protein
MSDGLLEHKINGTHLEILQRNQQYLRYAEKKFIERE